MWSFFKQKILSYNLRKRPILNIPRTQSAYYGTNAINFRGSLNETIFLLKLNPAIQFSNLKPELKVWEILFVDV